MSREKMCNENFFIAKSTIKNAGEGLFANMTFRKHERLLCYKFVNGKDGDLVEQLTEEQFLRRYAKKRPEYVFYNPQKKIFYDATKGGLAAKANTNPGNQNARFDCAGNLFATKGIKKDTEIFVSYGAAYWNAREAHPKRH